MKNWKHKIKKIVLALSTGICVGAFIFLLIAAQEHHKEKVCRSINFNIDYNNENFFIEKSDLVEIISDHVTEDVVGKNLTEIRFDLIEDNIKKIPYVASVETFVDIAGDLNIEVKQREPIVRVINKRGVSYYLDDHGEKMPISDKFTSRVLIASGYIEDNGLTIGKVDSLGVNKIYELSNYIRRNPYWTAQIEQIYVDEYKDFIIIPKLGNHEVVLGTLDNMDKKFKDLYIFYNEGLKYAGWYTYKTISLKYQGQIVCTKY